MGKLLRLSDSAGKIESELFYRDYVATETAYKMTFLCNFLAGGRPLRVCLQRFSAVSLRLG